MTASERRKEILEVLSMRRVEQILLFFTLGNVILIKNSIVILLKIVCLML